MNRASVGLVAVALVLAAVGVWTCNGAAPDAATTASTEPATHRRPAAPRVRGARLEAAERESGAESAAPEPAHADPVVRGETVAGVVVAGEARVRFRLRMPAGSADDFAVWWGFFDEDGRQRAENAVGVRLDQLEMNVVAPVTARRMRINVRDFVPVWRDVRPAPGTVVDLGEIAIDAGGTIAGRVTCPDGSPPPDVRICVWDAAKQEIFALRSSGDNGAFSLPGTPRAPVLVEFEAEGFVPVERRIDATVAGEALAISMVRGALVTVRVLGADGKSVDWCAVDVLDTNRAPTGFSLRSRFRTQHSGRVPEGRYLIVASREEGETAESVVNLTEGGTEEITLRLSK